MFNDALVWLGIWALVFDIFFVLPLFFYLRRMSRKKFIYIMYVFHHWLQNFDRGYDYDAVVKDLEKVEKYG